MALRYYLDVHVPSSVADGLRQRGIDVLTSQDDKTREASDEDLLQRASELGRILFSQDLDLLKIARDWQSQQRRFSGLVFAPQIGFSVGRTIEELALIAACCDAEELKSQVVFLPLN